MTKIERPPLEQGIDIAITAMQSKNIVASIQIDKLPEDDSVKEGEFAKLIRLSGVIESDFLTDSIIFYLSIPVATHRNAGNWAWVIAYEFLGEAIRVLLSSEGITENTKQLIAVKSDLVDELIKNK